jgi:hypothetical protein
MVGQSWYLLASSCGLIGVAFFFIVSRLRDDGGRRTIGANPERVTLLVVLMGAAAIIFTGGLQLLYGDRGDHLVYGRYVEMLVPALLMFACIFLERNLRLARLSWLFSSASILIVACLYVVIDGSDGLRTGHLRDSIVYPNIAGLEIARYLTEPGLITFGILFFSIALVFWFISRFSAIFAIFSFILFASCSSMFIAEKNLGTRTEVLDRVNTTVGIVKKSGTEQVGFDIEVRNDRSYYYMRYKLHPIHVVRFDISGLDAIIPASFSCVYGMPNKPPSDGIWAIVATESAVGRVLWQRAGTAHC